MSSIGVTSYKKKLRPLSILEKCDKIFNEILISV